MMGVRRVAGFSGRRRDGRKALALEVVFQTLGDIRVIFDNEYWSLHQVTRQELENIFCPLRTSG